MKIKSLIISFWFKELSESTSKKVYELEDNLISLFNSHFMYTDMPAKENIDIPRVQCLSKDKRAHFTMSLVSANYTVNVDNLDNDEIIMLANENMQLLYDVLVDLYNIEVLYSSIKIEANKEDSKVIEKMSKYLSLEKGEYEDLSFKKVKKIDDTYYECIILNSGKEVNYDIQVPVEKPKENDLYTRSMLISTSQARLGKYLFSVNYEINDRLSYNNDKDYLSNKESIRGLIIELKDFIEKRLNKLL